jgi:hypothetical protein
MNDPCRFASLLLVALPLVVHAEDARLSQLRALLVPMRANQLDHLEARGARPELTVVKHGLRDWIESRLSAIHYWEVPGALERQLNDEIRQARLFCRFGSRSDDSPCPEWSALGYVGEIKLGFQAGGSFLVVRTAVGIQQCGFDESAYAYQWAENHWQRFWQSEQNEYTEKKYFPQTLYAVLISRSSYDQGADKSAHLILTLGNNPWCTSNWQPVYYRVWQTKSSYREPKLLLDESDFSFLANFPPILGSVGPKDVLIEYTVGSGDSLAQEIRHYVVKEDQIQRVDPIALSPRAFADAWLRYPWAESSRWSEPGVRAAHRTWHEKRKGPLVSGEFIGPTLHCAQKPDLWQVGIDFGHSGKEHAYEYFLIRWRPPYRFTMAGVSDHPWPGCAQEDPEADESRTLFPVQDWR